MKFALEADLQFRFLITDPNLARNLLFLKSMYLYLKYTVIVIGETEKITMIKIENTIS